VRSGKLRGHQEDIKHGAENAEDIKKLKYVKRTGTVMVREGKFANIGVRHTYLIITYLLTYILHGAESFLRS